MIAHSTGKDQPSTLNENHSRRLKWRAIQTPIEGAGEAD
jgi:hypothetical protein